MKKSSFSAISTKLIFSFLFILTISSSLDTNAFAQDNDNYAQLNAQFLSYNSAKGEKMTPFQSWAELLQNFENLKVMFPQHAELPRIYYRIGQINYILYYLKHQKSFLDQSLKAYQVVISHFEKSTLADDCQIAMARIYDTELKDPKKAKLAYLKVLKTFDGDQTKFALARLKSLGVDPTQKLEEEVDEKPIPSSKINLPNLQQFSREAKPKQATREAKPKQVKATKPQPDELIKESAPAKGKEKTKQKTSAATKIEEAKKASTVNKSLPPPGLKEVDIESAPPISDKKKSAEASSPPKKITPSNNKAKKGKDPQLEKSDTPAGHSLEDKDFPFSPPSQQSFIETDDNSALAAKTNTSGAPSNTFPQQGGIPIEISRTMKKAEIISTRYWSTPRWLRVVITLNRPIPYLFGRLSSSADLPAGSSSYYLDLLDSFNTSEPEASLNEPTSILKDLLLTTQNSRISRLQIQLKAAANFNIIAYEQTNHYVISLETRTTSKETQSNFTTASKKSTKATQLEKVNRIVIDPGHGGRDPGASAFDLVEKDVVLEIAKHVKQQMSKKADFEVVLTRSKDQFLSIEERTAKARQVQGDLFISLHLNAHSEEHIQGLETYYFDVTNDDASRRLTLRENAMNDQGFANFSRILHDMNSSAFAGQSLQLSHAISFQTITQMEKKGGIKIRNLGVKAAPFIVLLGVDMPAVLVELAFLTNSAENQQLRNPRFQKLYAEGIVHGIENYFEHVAKN